MSPAQNEFELTGLQDRLSELHDRPAEAIVTTLLDDVRDYCSPHEPKNDVTLLVVKREL